MKAINVLISRMDGACRIRVDGLDNTQWLLRRLSDLFIFKTSEPLYDVPNSSSYSFRVAHNSQMSGPRFEKLLASIAGVKVILEPSERELALGAALG
jgi:hypothetical protein